MLTDELRDTSSRPNLDDPKLAQPLCTALQIALVDLLASWHVFPQAVQGHSSGEKAVLAATGETVASSHRFMDGGFSISYKVTPMHKPDTAFVVQLRFSRQCRIHGRLHEVRSREQ